jgi:thioredoxin 1
MKELNDDELEKIRIKKLRDLIEKQQIDSISKNGQYWPSTSISVDDNTFHQTITEYPFVVIDCWAQWCGPCHMIAPVIEDLAKEYAGKIVFGKLDTDLNKMSANRYRIMSIPSLLIFKNGKLVDQLTGAMSKDMLEPILIKHWLRN